MKKRVRKIVDNFWDVIKRPEMLILPGQLAFFFILSIVPILTLISYGVVSFNLSLDFIESFLAKSFGSDIANLIIPHVTNVNISFGFILTIIVGLFFASNGASSIIIASNTVYNIKDKGFAKRRVKAAIMTIFMIILFLFIMVFPLFGESIINLLKTMKADTSFAITLINVVRGPISWFVIFFFIKLLYTMAPDKRIPSSQTNHGALFTSIGWIISTAIYSFYINNIANYSIFYGSLTNIIILMLWTYLLAYIFTVGLAFNYKRDVLYETQQIEIKEKNKSKK